MSALKGQKSIFVNTCILSDKQCLLLPAAKAHLEASVLGQPEAALDRCYCVAPVGVTRHILIDGLQPDL